MPTAGDGSELTVASAAKGMEEIEVEGMEKGEVEGMAEDEHEGIEEGAHGRMNEGERDRIAEIEREGMDEGIQEVERERLVEDEREVVEIHEDDSIGKNGAASDVCETVDAEGPVPGVAAINDPPTPTTTTPPLKPTHQKAPNIVRDCAIATAGCVVGVGATMGMLIGAEQVVGFLEGVVGAFGGLV